MSKNRYRFGWKYFERMSLSDMANKGFTIGTIAFIRAHQKAKGLVK